MKWSLVGLVLAGVLVAIFSAVLIAFWRAGAREVQPAPTVQVVLAAKDMPAVSVVDADSIVLTTVPEDRVPENYLSDPVQVVGKVLCTRMVKGQIFTRACFAAPGSGVQLASSLPQGMRAVSISLPDAAALEGLLYPGSVVDVLVSFRDSQGGSSQGPLSTTLLQGIQVLAVENYTGTSASDAEDPARRLQRLSGRPMVTFMMEPDQAKAFKLAAEHGTVSLALRNPLDVSPDSKGPAFLRHLAGDVGVAEEPQEVQAGPSGNELAQEEVVPVPADATQEQAPQWSIVIIRGGASETRLFAPPAGEQRRPEGE